MICLLIKRKNCNTPTSILQSGRTITFPTLALSKSGNGLKQYSLLSACLHTVSYTHLASPFYLSHAFEEIQLSGNQSVISERKPGAYREIYIITDEYWER